MWKSLKALKALKTVKALKAFEWNPDLLLTAYWFQIIMDLRILLPIEIIN